MVVRHRLSHGYLAIMHPVLLSRPTKKTWDYVSHFFENPMYVEAYKPMIYRVPRQHDWTSTNTSDMVPPFFKINKGKTQEKIRRMVRCQSVKILQEWEQ
jgi:hypothetical protein